MNSTLLFHNVKSTYKIWLIFVAIMFMYKSIIVGMYDPESMDAMQAMLDMMPEGMINAFGYQLTEASLVGFISGYYYGFLIILFPLIFTIMLSFKLVGKYVDNGSMAYLLSTPNTRQKIIVTQMITLLGALFDLFFTITLIGIVFSALFFPGELAVGKYILLNLGAYFLFIAVSGLAFFCSTVFNESKHSLGLAIALPVGFYLAHMLRNTDEQLDFLKYITLYTLYDNQAIIALNPIIILQFIVLFIIGFVFYTLSIILFKRKDLTL